MLFQIQFYIIFSQKVFFFFFLYRQKQILANTNNRKYVPKRIQQSWSVIMQFMHTETNIDMKSKKINVTLMTKKEKQFGESRGN